MYRYETFRKRNKKSNETTKQMPRCKRSSVSSQWLYDNGKEWWAVPCSYVSTSIPSIASLAQEKHINQKPKVLMITISRNPNFKEWLNIKVGGILVDNVQSKARAIHVANQLQMDHKKKTGERLTIINKA